jgi:hypothetical protein
MEPDRSATGQAPEEEEGCSRERREQDPKTAIKRQLSGLGGEQPSK